MTLRTYGGLTLEQIEALVSSPVTADNMAAVVGYMDHLIARVKEADDIDDRSIDSLTLTPKRKAGK